MGELVGFATRTRTPHNGASYARRTKRTRPMRPPPFPLHFFCTTLPIAPLLNAFVERPFPPSVTWRTTASPSPLLQTTLSRRVERGGGMQTQRLRVLPCRRSETGFDLAGPHPIALDYPAPPCEKRGNLAQVARTSPYRRSETDFDLVPRRAEALPADQGAERGAVAVGRARRTDLLAIGQTIGHAVGRARPV